MKFKTLIAVAVAAAFPLAALAQGSGGTTTAPSATHPQGNPPATATPGAQSGEKAPDLAKDKRAKKDKDAKDADSGTGATGSSGSSSSGTTGSGAGNMGSGSSGSTTATPKSPSSGGPASSTGSKNAPTEPK